MLHKRVTMMGSNFVDVNRGDFSFTIYIIGGVCMRALLWLFVLFIIFFYLTPRAVEILLLYW